MLGSWCWESPQNHCSSQTFNTLTAVCDQASRYSGIRKGGGMRQTTKTKSLFPKQGVLVMQEVFGEQIKLTCLKMKNFTSILPVNSYWTPPLPTITILLATVFSTIKATKLPKRLSYK